MVRSEKGRERNIREKIVKVKRKSYRKKYTYFFYKKPVYKNLEAGAP